MTAEHVESWLLDSSRRPLVMGILNITPDSFSDGGQFTSVDRAVEHTRRMVEQGADLIDVGGESTRPGSDPVSADEQIRRVVPVIEAIRSLGIAISVDTTRAAVARAALDVGAAILNDVSAGRFDDALLPLAASRGVPIVLMHMLGTPKTMHVAPDYVDVVAEVKSFLIERAAAAIGAGVAKHRILLDVGIGFGKTIDHNLALLRAYETFAHLRHATLLGASRKRFLGTLTGVETPCDRDLGTAASVAWGIAQGASIVRVHDVDAARQVVQVVDAIRSGRR